MTKQRTLSALFLSGALAVALAASTLVPDRAEAALWPEDCGEGGPIVCNGTTDWTGYGVETRYDYRTQDPGEPLLPYRPGVEP